MISAYLRPIAPAESPQSEEGDAIRLAGGMVYASRFAVILREGAKIVSRERYSARQLEAALPSLPAEAAEQFANLKRTHAPLQCGARTIRLDQPQVMGILNVTPDSFSDGGEFLDKPEVANAHAAMMLSKLSGQSHKVLTAVVVNGHLRLSVSHVQWRVLDDDEISRYVASGEPMGKAGAYAIQGRSGAWTQHIDGSYSGIMGLPLFDTAELLKPLGWHF